MVCVRFIAWGRGGYRCCNLKTFGTFSSSFPSSSFSSSSPHLPPPSTGMWPTLMMSLHLSALPVFCSSIGMREIERERDGEIGLTKSIFPLRQQRQGSADRNGRVCAPVPLVSWRHRPAGAVAADKRRAPIIIADFDAYSFQIVGMSPPS